MTDVHANALDAVDRERGAAASLEPSRKALDWWLLLLILIAPYILQRFAFPFAASRIPVCLAWFYGFMAVLLVLRQYVIIDAARLMLFGLVAVFALISTFVNWLDASILSLTLLLLTYAPFVFRVNLSEKDYLVLLRIFQAVALFVVCCGVIQFVTQFVLGKEAMFPVDLALPSSFFLQGYNLRIPVTTGSDLLKSTGLWLLEPSHFSQLSALAFIVEALFFRRALWLGAFVLGLFLSFSGTGLMLLMAIGPLILARRRSIGLFSLCVVVAIGVIAAGETLFVQAFTSRVASFGSDQSSAYARFLSPFVILHRMVAEGGIHLLFGNGAGTMTSVMLSTDFESHDTSWIKLVEEYGVLTAVPFFAYYGYALFKQSPSISLAAAFLFQFLFLGGYLLSPYIHIPAIILAAWPRIPPIANADAFHARHGSRWSRKGRRDLQSDAEAPA